MFSQVQKTDAYGNTYTQTLWPDHCVVGTDGVKIDVELRLELERLGDGCVLVRKVSTALRLLL